MKLEDVIAVGTIALIVLVSFGYELFHHWRYSTRRAHERIARKYGLDPIMSIDPAIEREVAIDAIEAARWRPGALRDWLALSLRVHPRTVRLVIDVRPMPVGFDLAFVSADVPLRLREAVEARVFEVFHVRLRIISR